MTEEFIQHLWHYKLFEQHDLVTSDGKKIHVHSPGVLNCDAGPDFFNARISINDTIWVGNVEIHHTAKDWYHHGHHNDPAYNNVILHVSLTEDKSVVNSAGIEIPNVRMPFNPHLWINYQKVMSDKNPIPCHLESIDFNDIYFNQWMERMLIERIWNKTELFQQLYKQLDGDIQATAYIFISRAFGFSINALPMEGLARSIPVHLIQKNNSDAKAMFCLLAGQSGLMSYDKLSDYSFVARKYNLIPMGKERWKLSRTRPSNFPLNRIVQLALLLSSSTSLIDLFSPCKSISDFYKVLNLPVPDSIKSIVPTATEMGKSSILLLIVNAVIPMLFAYYRLIGKEDYADSYLELLRDMKAENNTIIRLYISCGYIPASMFESQALLQLHNEYCSQKKCLKCGIGNIILHNE